MDFDIQDTDVYWCTADVGWITGHSYVVYGPLSNGATTLMYEGVTRASNPGCTWDIIENTVSVSLHRSHGNSSVYQDRRSPAQCPELVFPAIIRNCG
jgi:hypothetical protein